MLSCPTLRDPWTAAHQAPLLMEFSRQILEWVVISSSRGTPQPSDPACVASVSCIGRQLLLPSPKVLVLMQLQVWLHSGLQDKIKIQFLIISLSFVGVLPSQISLGSKLESAALILLSSLVSSPAKRSEHLCPRILYLSLALTGHLSGPGPIIMVMGGAAELPSGSPRAAGAAEGNDEDGRGAAITAHD